MTRARAGAQAPVRFVGDIVAVVVAETRAQAVDAAEAVIVDYDPLPAVIDMEDALVPDAPLLFESIGSNIVLGTREPDGVDPLAGADVVVRGRFENQRVAVVPDGGRRRRRSSPATTVIGHDLTMYLGCQMPHLNRGRSPRDFGLEPDAVRVIAPHVGGVVRRQALGAGGHRRGARRVRARPPREVDRDPLGEHGRDDARARPGPVRRARAHAMTAPSSACGAG